MYVLDFSIQLRNAEGSVTLLRSDSTTGAFPAILKKQEQAKETLAVESVFGIVINEQIGQLKFFKKNATNDIFR